MLGAKELELQAFNIASYFRREFIKYDYKIYNIQNVKKSKWWVMFERTAEKFSNREGWDADLFVKAQFNLNGKIYPFDLLSEKAWNNFIDYKNSKEAENTPEVEDINFVLDGFRAVKEYCKNNDTDFSVELFIKNKKNFNNIIEKNIPKHFFLFSKAFNKEHTLPDKEKYKKLSIASDKRLLICIKKVLKVDYV